MTQRKRTQPRGHRAPRSFFGLALIASLALTAVMATSASAVSISPPTGYTMAGGEATSTNTSVSCYNATTGSAQFTTGQSGSAKLKFTNCRFGGGLGPSCTTAGQAAGTILTNQLDAKLDYISNTTSNPPATEGFGIGLRQAGMAQNKSVVAEFSCGGEARKWVGGIIAKVTSPGLNAPATKKATLSFGTSTWLMSDVIAYKKGLEGGPWSYNPYILSEERPGWSTKTANLQFSTSADFLQAVQFLP
jgi:hypothetical protein